MCLLSQINLHFSYDIEILMVILGTAAGMMPEIYINETDRALESHHLSTTHLAYE